MDQKKEELRQWRAEQEKLQSLGGPSASTAPEPQYNHPESQYNPPAQQPAMDPEYERELRKQQMEQELAEQMAKLNEQNSQGLAGNNYQDPQPTHDQNYGRANPESYGIPGRKSSNGGGVTPAGGKSIKSESEEHKFSLGPSEDFAPSGTPHARNPDLIGHGGDSSKSIRSNYETSANSYGNYNPQSKLETLLQKNENQAMGRPVVNNDKGYNVITGEFFG